MLKTFNDIEDFFENVGLSRSNIYLKIGLSRSKKLEFIVASLQELFQELFS